jgi:hypothetical protein
MLGSEITVIRHDLLERFDLIEQRDDAFEIFKDVQWERQSREKDSTQGK